MKLNKYVKFFFEGPDDSFGGGNDGEDNSQVDQAPDPKPGPGFDVDDLVSKLGDKISSVIPKQDAPKMSPEEARKMLNVMEFDDSFLQRFENVETKKEALELLRDGLTRQNATITQILMHRMREELMSEFAPIRSFYEEQQVTARQGRFHKAYPQLADEKLTPIVQSVIQSLQSSGQNFGSDEKKAFTAIAQGVEAVIQRVNPDFKLEQNVPASSGKKPGNSNALSSQTSGGGAGGGGGKGNSPAPKSTALKFL